MARSRQSIYDATKPHWTERYGAIIIAVATVTLCILILT